MIAKLHYITHDIPGVSHQQLAEQACAAGVRWVQLRVKNKPYDEWKKIAEETQIVCRRYGAQLIINDNVQLAKEIGADGVHVGKEDISVAEARKILGKGMIIGGTANTYEDIKKHYDQGVDYIGLGPFRFTATKEKLSPVLGSEGYEQILRKCKEQGIDLPVIAIGGITNDDVQEIMDTGIYGVAVSNAISLAADKKEVVQKFNDVMMK